MYQYCTALELITLPQGLTRIGGSCFYGCTNLTSIVVPDQVTFIDSSTFWRCTNLKTITIGKSVRNIYSKAFGDCKGLESVICMAETPPTAQTDIFENSYIGYVTLYVPENSVTLYQSKTPWSEFGKIVGNNTFIEQNNVCPKESKPQIYDLNANKLESLKPGLNIIRMSSGRTRKIVVK